MRKHFNYNSVYTPITCYKTMKNALCPHRCYVIPGINISNCPSRLPVWPCSREVFCFKYVSCKGATRTVVIESAKVKQQHSRHTMRIPNYITRKPTHKFSPRIQSTDPHLFPCAPLQERRSSTLKPAPYATLPTRIT